MYKILNSKITFNGYTFDFGRAKVHSSYDSFSELKKAWKELTFPLDRQIEFVEGDKYECYEMSVDDETRDIFIVRNA